MTQTVAVAKIGKNVFSTSPNDFVFNSKYNTFKIIVQKTITITLAASTNNQSFSDSHGLDFIPLPMAFAKESALSQVFLPNSQDVSGWGAKTGWIDSGVHFNYITTNLTNINFNFDNTNGVTKSISIRYFLLEKVTT